MSDREQRREANKRLKQARQRLNDYAETIDGEDDWFNELNRQVAEAEKGASKWRVITGL